MLVGKVVVSEGASFRTLVPWIPAKRTFRSKIAYGPSCRYHYDEPKHPPQLSQPCDVDANVIMMDEPVTRSSVTASGKISLR